MGKRRRLELEDAAKRRRMIFSSSSEDDIPSRPNIDDTSLGTQVLPTSDSCSEIIEVAPSTAEETKLDDEILTLLGDAPKDETVLGKPTHKDISNRWQEILQRGLPSDIKEKLLKGYLIPSNCEMLLAPKINPEVKAAVAENICKRDCVLTAKQNQIGTALAALSQALDSILVKDFSVQKLLKPISDACRILCDSHYTETKTRRHFVMSTINQNMKETMSDTTRDKYLFGENIAEKLKYNTIIVTSQTGSPCNE